jgi:3-oxo-5-alpha-steroid 4-dehydrogenase 1
MSFEVFQWLCVAWMILAAPVVLLLIFVRAPYGRHVRSGWGILIPARQAWLIMELPGPLILPGMLLASDVPVHPVALLAAGLYVGHYVYRAVIYPLLIPSSSSPMPVSVMAMAIVFNSLNATLNGLALGTFWPFADREFSDFWVVFGVLAFLTGFVIHVHSDWRMRVEKRLHDNRRFIPNSGLHRMLASPNYFGEIVQWAGFAVMAGTLAALSFAVWTVANLLPRAISHWRWYRKTFPEYPRSRRAILPWIL